MEGIKFSLRPREPEHSIGVGLGKNWSFSAPQRELELSQESKITALALAYLYLNGAVGKILFSTGETAGRDKNGNRYPTEALAMKNYMRQYFGVDLIPEKDIILEVNSFDTAGNAEEVKEIIRRNSRDTRIALVTVGYHLPRSERLFRNHGVKVDAFSSDDILNNIVPHHPLLRQYYYSPRRAIEYGKELLGRALVHTVDPKGRRLRAITAYTRHRRDEN